MAAPSEHHPDHHRVLRRRFAGLWGRTEMSVQAFVFSLVPSFHDAEDLLQQIAEESAERFDEFDETRGSFEAWVILRARRRIIDHFRKKRRDRHVFDDAIIQRVADLHIQRAGSSDSRTEALEHCIDQLPDKSRRLLEARYVDDRTPAEIADESGSTAGSIRVQLHRVRDVLADCIRRYLAREFRS